MHLLYWRFISQQDLIESQGYPFEEHLAVTDDGYILTIHRIPHGRKNPGKIGRPVLLQHGILCDSAGWVLSTPEKGLGECPRRNRSWGDVCLSDLLFCLGFILADQGYDVWMPNSRGTTYSKMHKYLDIHSAKYWDFRWEKHLYKSFYKFFRLFL